MARRALWWLFFLGLFAFVATRIGLLRFWIFGAVAMAFVMYVTSASDPTLMPERLRPAGPTADRGALAAIRLFAAIGLTIALLDIGRFHWSDTVPPQLRAPAMVVYAAALFLIARAMVVNRFFSTAIRVQHDRGQVVVTSGPYAIVRHPGYLGMIVVVPAQALALGSWYALAPALVYSMLIARRASVEDRYLREHLDGYAAYAERVRYRIVPGVW
jgi:protein-S-isoprenylcysteine O-methyltransferase Ste14